jgi:hypothetical protein
VDAQSARVPDVLCVFGSQLTTVLKRRQLGVEVLQAVRGGDLAVLDGHGGLDHTSDTTCCFRVADVGLDRPDDQAVIGAAVEDARSTLHFDGISNLGTSAVALEVGDVIRAQVGLGHGLANNSLLAVGAGQRNTRGLSVARGCEMTFKNGTCDTYALMADARTTLRMGSPSLRASLKRLT